MSGELPEGWANAKMAYFAMKVGSGATPRGGSESYKESGVPLIRSQNVHFDGFRDEGLAFLDDVQAASLKEVTVEAGDVLLNITGASIGRVTQAPEGMRGARVNQHVCIIRPVSLIDSGYLARYLSSPDVQKMVMVEEYGVTRQALTKGQILDFDIPIAPLPEQKRIVATVEAVLARVSAARQRLAKLPGKLKRFRQAVLAAACSGRLTSDWRQDDGEQAELPNSWQLADAGKAYLDARYGTSVKCDRPEIGTPVLRVPNIARGVLDLSDLKYAELTTQERKALAVQEGDVIVCRTNGSLDLIGKAAVAPRLSRQCAFASYLIRLRFDKAKLLPTYFHAFLSGPAGRDQIEKRARTTAGQFNLNLDILRNLQLPLPPLAEQHEIVRRVEALFRLADVVEKRVAAATARAERLTQSILAKAFRGELVPTEAELARAEGRNYEPASALLERIRSEREADAVSLKRNGRRRKS
jgi:type I restriction enzyme S subunit